jgi:hypothetical protein
VPALNKLVQRFHVVLSISGTGAPNISLVLPTISDCPIVLLVQIIIIFGIVGQPCFSNSLVPEPLFYLCSVFYSLHLPCIFTHRLPLSLDTSFDFHPELYSLTNLNLVIYKFAYS